MIDDIRRLSGPEFNGRQTGTIDDLRSAGWIAGRFRALGLKPAVPNPLQAGVQQPWMMIGPATVHSISPTLTVTLLKGNTVIPLQIGPDYLPLLDSPTADMTAPVAFVGYGVTDVSQGYDDYHGIDVARHIVLFLRGKPPWYEGSVSHEEKVRLARLHGAVGFLTVTGPVMTPYEARRGVGTAPLAYYGQQPGAASAVLPGAWVSVQAAEQFLSQTTATVASLATLQEEINQQRRPRSQTTSAEVRMLWEQRDSQGTLHNVVGLLEGSDPSFSDETIVIGAHRDHFGRQGGLLFAGADDNASGTAVILEVARAFTVSEKKPKRSVLFVSFSGEEQGLLGSTLYVNRPVRPLGNTVAMINIDHAGIGNGRLTVGVTGLEKSGAAQAGESSGLSDKLDLFGFFPGGDHVPFKEAGVATLTVVSGGPHPHFHQATDTSDTIRPDVLLSAAKYVLALAQQLAQ